MTAQQHDLLNAERYVALRRWTAFYALTGNGWAPEQARRVLFLRWLVDRRRITDDGYPYHDSIEHEALVRARQVRRTDDA